MDPRLTKKAIVDKVKEQKEFYATTRTPSWMSGELWSGTFIPKIIREKKKWEQANSEILILIWVYDGCPAHRISPELEANLLDDSIFAYQLQPDITGWIQPVDSSGFFRTLKTRVRDEMSKKRFHGQDAHLLMLGNRFRDIVFETYAHYSVSECFRDLFPPGGSRLARLMAE